MKDVAGRITWAVNAEDFLCIVQSDSNAIPDDLHLELFLSVVLCRVFPKLPEFFLAPHIAQISTSNNTKF